MKSLKGDLLIQIGKDEGEKKTFQKEDLLGKDWTL